MAAAPSTSAAASAAAASGNKDVSDQPQLVLVLKKPSSSGVSMFLGDESRKCPNNFNTNICISFLKVNCKLESSH